MDNHINKKTGFKLLEVVIIMIITVSLGVAVGVGIVFFNIDRNDLKFCAETNISDNNIKEIVDTYNSIINNYYTDVDKDELASKAIEAMLEALGDPYSTYMNIDETTSFNERMKGDYQGIGAEISYDKDGNIVILKIFGGSPAETAGLKALDIITKVDGKSIAGLSTAEVAALLKGKINTAVKVTITRNDIEKEVTITRNKIIIPSIQQETFTKNNKKVGYIKIDIFSDNTYDQFKAALLALEKEKIDSLIIDVRDNSGGYLNRVSEIVSMFLPKDKIIYQLSSKDKVEKIYSYTKDSRSYPIAVLINKYSASASEILAAALKESYGATIIGINSFGKGTVQQTFSLDTGGMIKYTIQKWLTPKGNWINNTGITPDIELEQGKDYYNNPTSDNDLQLQKAIETLSK